MGANFYAKDNVIDPKIREFHGNIWMDTGDASLPIDTTMSLYMGAAWAHANGDVKADFCLTQGSYLRLRSILQVKTSLRIARGLKTASTLLHLVEKHSKLTN